MPSILKREFAPISDRAWSELDAEAARVLKKNLAGRKVVDFAGPYGWELGAVNLGRLKTASKKAPGGIGWGTREVLPLIEVRIPFTLTQMEIDNLTRGSLDADIDALTDTAAKAAKFEDTVIFEGFAPANMAGLARGSQHRPLKLPTDAEKFPQAVSEAVQAIGAAGIEGPYALVLGPDAYFTLRRSARHGYPPSQAVRDILDGEIHLAPALTCGAVVSCRGGDYELTVGKDFSLGYAGHDRDSVEFFITESFAFRVIEPAAAVAMNPPA